MRVAVCVWGLLRSLLYTHESIQQYVLFPLQHAGYDYDVLLHTYSFKGAYSNIRTGELADAGLMNFSEWRLLQPSYVYVEDQDAFDASIDIVKYATQGDPWDNGLESLRNHLRALNSLFHLSRMVELANSDPFHCKTLLSRGGADSRAARRSHELSCRFDAVIFIRPDVLYAHYLPVELLSHFRSALFVPDFHRSCAGGQFNDRFAMGDAASAITYGRRFESALNYSLSKSLRSEDFTYDYLLNARVTVIEFPFRFMRVRVGGGVHARDAHLVLPHEQLALANGAMPRETPWAMKLLYRSDVDDPYNIYCSPHPLRINVSEADAFTSRSADELVRLTAHRLAGGRGDGSADPTPAPGLGGMLDRTISAYKSIFRDSGADHDDFFMRADAGRNNTAGGSSSTFASSSALASSSAAAGAVAPRVRRGSRRRRRGGVAASVGR